MTITYQPPQPPISLTVADNLASGLAPVGFTHVQPALAKHPSRLRRFLERTLPTSVIWLSAPVGAIERTFPRTLGAVDQALREIEALARSN